MGVDIEKQASGSPAQTGAFVFFKATHEPCGKEMARFGGVGVAERPSFLCSASPPRRSRPTALVERELRAAGFEDIELETVELSSRVTALDAAQGIVLGSPFRAEIERLDPSALERAVTAVTEALLPWDGKSAPMSAHIATATR